MKNMIIRNITPAVYVKPMTILHSRFYSVPLRTQVMTSSKPAFASRLANAVRKTRLAMDPATKPALLGEMLSSSCNTNNGYCKERKI